jgi:hypothetical protein
MPEPRRFPPPWSIEEYRHRAANSLIYHSGKGLREQAIPRCLRRRSASSLCGSAPSLEAKLEHVPKRFHPVFPVYFFAFGVTSPEVANAKLINAKIPLPGYLGAHFHFDPEIVCGQPQ